MSLVLHQSKIKLQFTNVLGKQNVYRVLQPNTLPLNQVL